MSGDQPLPLTRRAALLAGTGATGVALSGCGDRSTQTSSDGGAADPDTRLLRRALIRELEVRNQLIDASRRHAALRSPLRVLGARHRQHIEVLADALGPETVAGEILGQPGLDAAQLARVLARSERALADTHARDALEARSGPFARVLAGMAAAAEQQAHVLDGLALTGSDRG